MLAAAAACCDAELAPDGRGGTGDPTELAILAAAAERGILRDEIEAATRAWRSHPFDSERKRMSILRADGVLYVKGAVEVDRRARDGRRRRRVEAAPRRWRRADCACWPSRSGERTGGGTACGCSAWSASPIRRAPRRSRRWPAARRAGIRTVMITGDHPVTARAIARELGIAAAGDEPAERWSTRARRPRTS